MAKEDGFELSGKGPEKETLRQLDLLPKTILLCLLGLGQKKGLFSTTHAVTMQTHTIKSTDLFKNFQNNQHPEQKKSETLHTK